MTEEATERGELRELLFDGVAAPRDGDAMFERTFAATGADGADLLPPDDLFDEPAAPEDQPLAVDVDDPTFDVDGTDPAPVDAPDDPAFDVDGTDPAPVDAPDDPAHGPDDGRDPGAVDHHDW